MTETQRLPWWTRLAGRTGSLAMLTGIVTLVLLGVTSPLLSSPTMPDAARDLARVVGLAGFVVFLFGMAAVYLPRADVREARPIRSPVRGRWSALNGPATKVPSHGLHAFGQTYAIDLVHEPEPGARPAFGGRRAMRSPSEYPAFGRPVHAPVDGVVTAAHDRNRDHRCRSNLLGFAYMFVEGFVLQLRGPGGIMGNRVVVTTDDGVSVVLAHLQRGSVVVEVGDRVRAGDVVAAVGNSGNTSEPHLHLQLMDRPAPSRAVGLPFTFTDVVVSDALEPPSVAPVPTVPEDEAVFHGGVPRDAGAARSAVVDGDVARATDPGPGTGGHTDRPDLVPPAARD